MNVAARSPALPREVQGRRSVLADRSAAFTVSAFSLRRDPANKSPLPTIFLRAGRPGSPRRVGSHPAPLRRNPQNNQSDNPLSGRTCRRCRSPGDAVAGQRPCRIPGEILANRRITTTKVYAPWMARSRLRNVRVEYYIYTRTSSLNRYNVDAVCISGFDYHPLFLRSLAFYAPVSRCCCEQRKYRVSRNCVSAASGKVSRRPAIIAMTTWKGDTRRRSRSAISRS